MKRTAWYRKNDPTKRLFYRIPLGTIDVDAEVFDRMCKRFGTKNTIEVIKNNVVRDITEIYAFVDPAIIRDEIGEMSIDEWIDKHIYQWGKGSISFEPPNIEDNDESFTLAKERL